MIFKLSSYLCFVRKFSISEGASGIVAARSKARTVFACLDARIFGSNPTQCMDVRCVYMFILCLC
jgi:hypothetical protein